MIVSENTIQEHNISSNDMNNKTNAQRDKQRRRRITIDREDNNNNSISKLKQICSICELKSSNVKQSRITLNEKVEDQNNVVIRVLDICFKCKIKQAKTSIVLTRETIKTEVRKQTERSNNA